MYENKTKVLTVFLAEDKNSSDEVYGQQVWSDDCDNISYNVHNLDECPEDATIGRDLFDAKAYINTLKLGIELAKQGFTDIVISNYESITNEK